jgi:branched-chain amino acid aminotransferase|tara:strand:- start:28584 stop:29483 length:900 start_codon:yes stop_codon:yes gene_type:complete
VVLLKLKTWFNGEFIEYEDAKVHISVHALHYGTGCIEGIHSYKTEKGIGIFRLKEHVDRFFQSAEALGMKLDFSKDEIIKAVKDLVRLNKIEDSYIRPIAFYGQSKLEVYPKNIKVDIAIISVPSEKKEIKGIKVKTSKFSRINPEALVYGAKISGFYANSILAMHEAREQGYDEALMLDNNGKVAEGPANNIFVIKNNKIMTSNSKSILPGVTRDSMIEIGKELGFEVAEKEIDPEELKEADEAFYTGTLSEIVPIIQIDDKAIGDGKIGKVTEKLKMEFHSIVMGKNQKFKDWVESV